MSVRWTRTKQGVAVSIFLLVLSAAALAGTAGVPGSGRWPARIPASSWSGTTWQVASPAERRSYLLGITDGLRMAAMFERAQVNLEPVTQCVQEMPPERLTRAVGAYLEDQPIEVHEPTLHFHVWDALVATCLGHARVGG